MQSGDTLSGLALRYLGSAHRWPDIVALNRIGDPDRILVGQRLAIPAVQSSAIASETHQKSTLGPDQAPLTLLFPGGFFVSSPFGNRTFPGMPTHFHAGHDIAGLPDGTPIRSSQPVRVHLSGRDVGGYGFYLVIECAGLKWLFGHLASAGPAFGALIPARKPIGLIGSTGASTGPHLHLESWAPGAEDWTARRDPSDFYRIETIK